jgi:prepilin-type N-terminal cleavage/methylation domain-containing protein
MFISTMKILHRSRQGFTLIELLVVIAIIAILAALAVPQIASAMVQGQLTQTLNNARQIHIAITRMAMDNSVNPDPKIGWPGDITDIQDIGSFCDRMVDYKYFERGDLRTVFAAPGVTAYNGQGNFSSQNSAFKIYRIKETDPGQCILVATKNFTFGQALSDSTAPYAKKGAVIFRKGGEGLKINDQQATNSGTGNLGLGEGGTSTDQPGSEGNPLQ